MSTCRRSPFVSAFLLSLLVHTWASTAAALPVLEVTSPDRPVVGGVVQLLPGDQNVTIEFSIVPDAVAVDDFEVRIIPSNPNLGSVSCTAVQGISIAICPGNFTDFQFLRDEDVPPMTEPFAIGSAEISVLVVTTLGSTLTADNLSFINETGMLPTSVAGQVVATVVPEPGSALLLGLGFAGLAVLRRRELDA